MTIGDRFFIIAYTFKPRVIEVELIEIREVKKEKFYHIERVDKKYDIWFLDEQMLKVNYFGTRIEAEKYFKLNYIKEEIKFENNI